MTKARKSTTAKTEKPATPEGLWNANDARIDPNRADAAARAVREQLGADADADFVTRLFDLLEERHPAINAQRLEMEKAVREHFGGTEPYISRRADRTTLAARALAMFNGSNARTVARHLGISRASVFRLIKQPGQPG